MLIPLPPKRYEYGSDPKYDPIRHLKWFRLLEVRREKIPLLESAQLDTSCGTNQVALCEKWGIDPREYRDFIAFSLGVGFDEPSPNEQKILDMAYEKYCLNEGKLTITRCITDTAWSFGVKYRHVTEKWEVDPNFYPTNYAYGKA